MSAIETRAGQITPQHLIDSARDPKEIIAEATERATALKGVVDQAGLALKVGGGEHLHFEAWQTLGTFYGISAKVVETHYVEFGGAQGFEAKAVAIRMIDGMVISAAEAMCLNDEDKWSTRPKYEYHYVRKSDGVLVAEDPGPGEIVWEENPNKPGSKRPKKKRVHVGDVPVPLFQLRSMAQTRACSKALRNMLSWVVVLAGYKPTPAEEMDGVVPEGSEGSSQPQEDPKGKGTVTAQQIKAVQAIRSKVGMSEAQLTDHIGAQYGLEGLSKISKGQASELIKYLQTFEEQPVEGEVVEE